MSMGQGNRRRFSLGNRIKPIKPYIDIDFSNSRAVANRLRLLEKTVKRTPGQEADLLKLRVLGCSKGMARTKIGELEQRKGREGWLVGHPDNILLELLKKRVSKNWSEKQIVEAIDLMFRQR